MSELLYDNVRQEVRKQYQNLIKLKDFGMTNFSCSCDTTNEDINSILGYSPEDFSKAPSEANLALGCANPRVYANYNEGDIVLDLGCGAGFDCFLASHEVGETGKVIGVDMLSEMISKARKIADEHKYKNVEFRLGEIEHLPIENNSIDIVISNCVLNLSPCKKAVIQECKRVMKDGARLLVFDILLDNSFSVDEMQELKGLKTSSCIKNAIKISEMRRMLEEEEFQDISIALSEKSDTIINSWVKNPELNLKDKVYSALIKARK